MAFVGKAIALILNLFGWTFYSHEEYHGIDNLELGGAPSSTATGMFSLGVFVLLLQGELYPRTLKKPHKFVVFFYQVIMSMILLEMAQIGIWYPVDAAIKTFLLTDYCEQSCYRCGYRILPILMNLLAGLFLYAILWATDALCSLSKYWRQGEIEDCPCTCHGQ